LGPSLLAAAATGGAALAGAMLSHQRVIALGLAVLFGAAAYGAVGLAFRKRLPLSRA
jgi:hypothetical protein